MGEHDRTTDRRDDTDDPRRSRERAVKILFQADVRHADAAAILQGLLDDPRARALLDEVDDLSDGSPLLPPIAHEPGVEVELVGEDEGTSRSSAERGTGGGTRGGRGALGADESGALDGFTRSLVLGVHEHRAGIDELVARFARRWQISRMPVVDRTVLRMATYELLHESTSPAVVIDEAVNLAKQLSTDDSGRYVNGVLESIRKHLRDVPRVAEDVAADEQAGSDEGAGAVTAGEQAGSDEGAGAVTADEQAGSDEGAGAVSAGEQAGSDEGAGAVSAGEQAGSDEGAGRGDRPTDAEDREPDL